MRTGVLVVGALVALVLVVTAIGYALPAHHTASREARLTASPERVFAAVQDVDRYPEWRSGVTSVDVLSRTPAPRWREHSSNGTLTFEIQEAQAPSWLVTRIADPSLPFGGSWTYVLTPDNLGTKLVITENGEVYNPLFRFMSRFVFGHTRTLDEFLRDLKRHVG